MTSDPWTGARLGSNSDSPLGGSYLAELLNELGKWVSPAFTSSAARDSALTAWVANGNTVVDGMRCTCAGLPYRRIGGTWRQDNGPRIIYRTTTPNSTISAGGGNETGVTGGIAALTSFTLYEAARVGLDASFRAGGAGAVATCYVKINGSVVGNTAISRADSHVPVTGFVDLPAGTYGVAAHVDATSATVTWVETNIKLTIGQAE